MILLLGTVLFKYLFSNFFVATNYLLVWRINRDHKFYSRPEGWWKKRWNVLSKCSKDKGTFKTNYRIIKVRNLKSNFYFILQEKRGFASGHGGGGYGGGSGGGYGGGGSGGYGGGASGYGVGYGGAAAIAQTAANQAKAAQNAQYAAAAQAAQQAKSTLAAQAVQSAQQAQAVVVAAQYRAKDLSRQAQQAQAAAYAAAHYGGYGADEAVR